nr:NUDIX hydrolase [Ferrimonas balearica]
MDPGRFSERGISGAAWQRIVTRYKPNVTVACVVNHHDRYLLVEEQIAGQVRLNQPAGHLEPNESLVQACARELAEETGIQRQPDHLLRIHQWQAPDGTQFVRFSFSLTLEAPLETAPQDPQIVACHWLTRAQIEARANQLRSPLVLSAIDDFESGRHYPLSLLDDRLAPV